MRYSKHLTYSEHMFLRSRLNRVRHITLDPDGPGVVRIHIVPCHKPDHETPFTVILNGQDILPLNVSWAILLTNLIEALKPCTGKEIRPEEWAAINAQAVAATRKIYRKTEYAQIESDLQLLVDSLCTIARGGEPPLTVQPMSLAEYAPRMVAPHRMGSDGQLDGQGRRVALQPEMPALLRCKPAAFRRAGAGHRPMAGRD